MTTPAPHPAAAGDGKAAGSADDTRRPAGALSPAAGPLPSIYVPRSPQASSTGLLWPAVLRAARRAGTWVTRQRPQHGPACQGGRSQATGSPALPVSTTVGASGAVGAVDARLSPGRFLYVDESKIGAVGEFAVHGSNLTELAGSPVSLPAGATPAGIIDWLSYGKVPPQGLKPHAGLLTDFPYLGPPNP
jgi:hypothetical protein